MNISSKWAINTRASWTRRRPVETSQRGVCTTRSASLEKVGAFIPVRLELSECLATVLKVRTRVSDVSHRSGLFPTYAEVDHAVAVPPHPLSTFPGRARSQVPPIDCRGLEALCQRQSPMRTAAHFVGSEPTAPSRPSFFHFDYTPH